MDKEAYDAIFLMATILSKLLQGETVEVADIWKLEEIACYFKMRGENDDMES